MTIIILTQQYNEKNILNSCVLQESALHMKRILNAEYEMN